MTDINKELLEALERSLNWLASYPGGCAENTYKQARTAIARAQNGGFSVVDLTVPEIHQTMSRCLDCGVISETERLLGTDYGAPYCPACGSDNI